MEWFDYDWRIGLIPAVITQLLSGYESVRKACANVTTKIGQHYDPPPPRAAHSAESRERARSIMQRKAPRMKWLLSYGRVT